MKVIDEEVFIIGAGLCGLTLAYLLRQNNISYTILEARSRIGGRIWTVGGSMEAPIEMGATWLGRKHWMLNKLLSELGIDIFEQKLGNKAIYEPISTSPHQIVSLPENTDPSFRIKGGSSALINALASRIDKKKIQLEKEVIEINRHGDRVIVKTAEVQFKAKKVVSTLPPYLLYKTINIDPSILIPIRHILKSTHTWMGESIKIALRFDAPFWVNNGLSATIFSNVGPITEMYEHTNFEENLFALKGFLNGTYYSLTEEERKHMVLDQLRKYYGKAIDTYVSYVEKVWRNDRFTFLQYDSHLLPHQNNGHVVYRKPLLDDRLYLAGSETASEFSGYMEGAVQRAYEVSKLLMAS